MSYMDHVRTCSDCQKRQNQNQNQEPTVRIKSASSYRRERKLSELAALVTGTSYPAVLFVGAEKKNIKTKGASSQLESKLKELAGLIRG